MGWALKLNGERGSDRRWGGFYKKKDREMETGGFIIIGVEEMDRERMRGKKEGWRKRERKGIIPVGNWNQERESEMLAMFVITENTKLMNRSSRKNLSIKNCENKRVRNRINERRETLPNYVIIRKKYARKHMPKMTE